MTDTDYPDGELIRGVLAISLATGEIVKASAPPLPSAQPPAAAAKPPELAAEVAKIAKGTGLLYTGIHSALQAKLPELQEQAKGSAVKGQSPNPRSRGAAEAVEFLLTALRPFADDTAAKGAEAGMKKEIGRRREEARKKASAGGPGSGAAMGAWEQYDAFLKRL